MGAAGKYLAAQSTASCTCNQELVLYACEKNKIEKSAYQ